MPVCKRRDRRGSARTSAGTCGCRRGRGRRRSCPLPFSLAMGLGPVAAPWLDVVDTSRAGAAEEGERLVVGVKYHLLRLTRVGPNEEHPAVAEADVRHLHRGRRAIDHYDLMAPVELVGFPRIEAQRHIGRGRCHLFLLGPGGRVSPDRIIATVISSSPEFLEDDGGYDAVRRYAA